jgi:uncharacterized protein (DUF302 family)
MEEQINKLIDKIDNETRSNYTYEEVIGMLQDLLHDAEINY